MMAAECPSARARLGWVAVLSSVGLHACLFGAYVFFLPRQRQTAAPLDTRVSESPRSYGLTLESPARKRGDGEGSPTFTVRVDTGSWEPAHPAHARAPVVKVDGMKGPRLIDNGNPGGEGSGEGKDTRFFGVPVRGGKVLFAIDRSLSMGLDRTLARAREELIAALRRLPSSAQFQVLCYNRTALPLALDGREDWLPADRETIDRVVETLATVTAEGDTDHFRALHAGLEFDPEMVFLATDGDGLTLAEVREITRLNRSGAVIHVIDVGRGGASSEAMRELARCNRGTCHRPPRAVSGPLGKKNGAGGDQPATPRG